MSPDSVTVKRQLGMSLKAAREAAGFSTRSAAPLLGVSQATVSRFERGLQKVTGTRLKTMAEVYKVPVGDFEGWLRLLGGGRRTDQWWHEQRYRPSLSAQYVELIEVENVAVSLTSIQLQVVPGLLQTREYSRALLENSVVPVEPERINALVAVRQVRQRRLFDPDPPMAATFWLSEAVLDLQYGGAAVHAAQMRQMFEFAKSPNIQIRVVPYSLMLDLNSADMYELPNGAHPVVYTESLLTGPHIENRYPLDDVERVMMAVAKLEQRALPPAMSVAAIGQRMT